MGEHTSETLPGATLPTEEQPGLPQTLHLGVGARAGPAPGDPENARPAAWDSEPRRAHQGGAPGAPGRPPSFTWGPAAEDGRETRRLTAASPGRHRGWGSLGHRTWGLGCSRFRGRAGGGAQGTELSINAKRSQQSALSERTAFHSLKCPFLSLGRKDRGGDAGGGTCEGPWVHLPPRIVNKIGGLTSDRSSADYSQNCGPQTVPGQRRLSAGSKRACKNLSPPVCTRLLGQVPSGESALPSSTDGGLGWAWRGGQLTPYTHMRVHTHAHGPTPTCMHTHVCAHVYTETRTYRHTCTHVCTHMRAHTHTNTLTLTLSHLPPHVSRQCPHPCL